MRLGLVPLFLGICYQFDWGLLCRLTSESWQLLSQLLGIPVTRISGDTWAWHGAAYRVIMDCTFIHAFCGSLPLLYNVSLPLLANLSFFAGYFVVLFVLNLLRLELGFLLYLQGVPWVLAHEALCGVAYFLLFLWVMHRHSWQPARA